jgi:hypothetical protein
MRNGVISQGTAGIGISNDRGLLSVTNFDIFEVVMTTGIRTDNGGLSRIEGMGVGESSIPVSLRLSSISFGPLACLAVLHFTNMGPELDGSCNICTEQPFR